jgi:hypothetical protein
MGLGAMIYIPSFIKGGSGFQKLIGGDTQTHREHGDLTRSKKSRQKNVFGIPTKKKRNRIDRSRISGEEYKSCSIEVIPRKQIWPSCKHVIGMLHFSTSTCK